MPFVSLGTSQQRRIFPRKEAGKIGKLGCSLQEIYTEFFSLCFRHRLSYQSEVRELRMYCVNFWENISNFSCMFDTKKPDFATLLIEVRSSTPPNAVSPTPTNLGVSGSKLCAGFPESLQILKILANMMSVNPSHSHISELATY